MSLNFMSAMISVSLNGSVFLNCLKSCGSLFQRHIALYWKNYPFPPNLSLHLLVLCCLHHKFWNIFCSEAMYCCGILVANAVVVSRELNWQTNHNWEQHWLPHFELFAAYLLAFLATDTSQLLKSSLEILKKCTSDYFFIRYDPIWKKNGDEAILFRKFHCHKLQSRWTQILRALSVCSIVIHSEFIFLGWVFEPKNTTSVFSRF